MSTLIPIVLGAIVGWNVASYMRLYFSQERISVIRAVIVYLLILGSFITMGIMFH